MKIPGLDDFLNNLTERGDEMQDDLSSIREYLYDIKELLILIEENTRPST